MAIKDVFHVNVNCTNLERSQAFYEQVGFKVVVELGLGGGRDMVRAWASRRGPRPRRC